MGIVSAAELACLLMKHRAALYGFIFASVRNHPDTEDILQIVALVVVESADQLKSEDGFFPWAREIARRRVLSHRRKNKREQPLDPSVIQALADAVDFVESQASTEVRSQALITCLDSLPLKGKQLLLDRYNGISAEAIAEKTKSTVHSIYAKIKRMKLVLKDCVQRRLNLEWET